MFAAPETVPEVPISAFKANPIAYADTGAVVMVHNRPRMRVVPIVAPDAPSILEIKTRLRLLNTLLDAELVEQERRDLAAERDNDRLDEPR
jgi:hypothetical protein